MLEAKIIYIPGHGGSVKQAEDSEKSFSRFEGWNASLRAGVTPKTHREPLRLKWIEDGRMKGHASRIEKFPEETERWEKMVLTKKSCATNHLRFWQEVVKRNRTMAFLEHDSICIGNWVDPEFKDCLILNMQYALDDPSPLARFWRHTPKNKEPGVYPLEPSYPVRYTYKNYYSGSNLIPGTAAYAMTPQGAQKMLDGVKKYGLDQSDYMINSKLVNLEYVFPSPVKFNDVNLKTSHGDGTRLP